MNGNAQIVKASKCPICRNGAFLPRELIKHLKAIRELKRQWSSDNKSIEFR